MSEKLSLQWSEFKENVIASFRSLKDDSDFHDVTFASEDANRVEAHKVILSISSPFFQNLLKINKHLHPLIYMRAVRSEDLLELVDFLYFGKANVCQDDPESFLAIAEELQLKGLMGSVTSDGVNGAKDGMPLQEKKILKAFFCVPK